MTDLIVEDYSDLVEIDVGSSVTDVNLEIQDDPTEVSLDAASSIVIIEQSLPPGGVPGDIIIKRTSADFDAEWVAPAQRAEADNTRPITAAAVYTEIGNINALLATI